MKERSEKEKKGIATKLWTNRITIARRLTQIASFFLIFGGIFGLAATHFILPIIAPLGNPYTTVGGAWAFLEITLTAGLFPAFSIAVITISSLLVGRLFCGWVCPLGTLYELESFFGENTNVSKSTNRALYMLSLLLAGVFLFISVSIGYREAISNSIYSMFGKAAREPSSVLDPLSTIVSMLFWFFWLEKYPIKIAGLADIPFIFWVRIGFLILSFFISFYITRGYCRYFCPLGGVMGFSGKHGLLTVYRDIRLCEECKECEEVCPMDVAITDFDGKVESPLCILCGACIEKCEEKALRLDLS